MNLFGASGHCKVIIDILKKNNSKITAIYDDDASIVKLLNYKVTCLTNDIKGEFIISIGNNRMRKKVTNRLNGYFGKAIHPQSIISCYSSINEGTVIMAGAIISADVKIGKHVIVNHNSSIDHDCCIENYVHVSPNASLAGNVIVEIGRAHV